MIELDGQSLHIPADNLQALQAIFPAVFTENQLDWEKLKATFSNQINFENERYVLNWAGKSEAYQNMQKTTAATLLPLRNESVHFDTTGHVFIEGENLEVLKVLQRSYNNRIKCIIIDPPYNTGSDSFVYADNFKERKNDYEKRIQDKNEEGYIVRDSMFRRNSKENGHFHSNWLSMMYPRLSLAKNLLKEDGVIFIHIDDNEVHNLRLLMNEIFGEENSIGCFCWRKKAGAGADSKYFFRQHEYILLYAKNINKIRALFQPLTEKQKLEYKNPDDDPRGNWAPTDLKRAGDNDPKRIYEVTSPTGATFVACWSYTKDNFRKLEEDNLIWWGKNGDSEPKRKRFLNDKEGLTPRSWIDSFLTSDGTKDLRKIDFDTIFDYPKPVGLIKQFLQIGSGQDDLILDFFGGSGTTAQAVLDLNQDEQSNRKFILVQIPEQVDESSEAFKKGYPTIAAIAKERIRKVLVSNSKTSSANAVSTQDLPGFKCFRLAPSNFKIWQSDAVTEDNIIEQLAMFTEPIAQEFDSEAMLYELLLKLGYPLTVEIEKKDNYYSIDEGKLIAVLTAIDDSIIKTIITAKPSRLIILDSLFEGNDQLKTNMALQLRDAKIEFKTL